MHADARKLIWDATRAVERVRNFTRGKTFAVYEADDLLRSAVERQLTGGKWGQTRFINHS